MKVSIVLDSRRVNKEGKSPLCLRFTDKKERLYIGIKYEATVNKADVLRMATSFGFEFGQFMAITEPDYKKATDPKAKGVFYTLSAYLSMKLSKAIEMIEHLPAQNIESLKKELSQQPETEIIQNDVLATLQQRETELRKQGRISTMKTFTAVRRSFEDYLKGKPLSFEALTVDWLIKYTKWMLSKGNSPTTIGIYLRNVRTIVNDRIEAGKLPRESTPFGRKRYQIPTGQNIKKALTIQQVRLISAYQPQNEIESFYRDLWLFSYFASGMNPTDIAALRYESFSNQTDPFNVGEYFTFERKKTEGKASQQVVIRVPITEPLSQILNRWANRKRVGFIFSIINRGMKPEQIYKAVQQLVKQENKYIGRIAKEVGITEKVTTYVARHSYATVLKRSGVSIEFISESLGHTSLKTTANYLDSFESETMFQNANKLI
jgi:site-specific recombinase XerD